METTEQSTGRLAATAAAIAAVAFLLGVALDWSPFKGPEPYTEIGTTVIQSVRDVADLTTVEVVESTLIEKGNDAGWLNWASGDKIVMMVVAEIGAGVDLSGLSANDFTVDSETGAVKVRLPNAEIQYVATDNEATQVFDRDTGLFTKGDPQLESDARQVAEQVLVDKALAQDILLRADRNAKEVVENLLTLAGYTSVEFAVRP